MNSKISSTYWFYNRAARVSGFVAIECCSKNSTYKLATIGETGLLIAVLEKQDYSLPYWRNRTTHCRIGETGLLIAVLEKQDYSLPYWRNRTTHCRIGETGLLIAVLEKQDYSLPYWRNRTTHCRTKRLLIHVILP